MTDNALTMSSNSFFFGAHVALSPSIQKLEFLPNSTIRRSLSDITLTLNSKAYRTYSELSSSSFIFPSSLCATVQLEEQSLFIRLTAHCTNACARRSSRLCPRSALHRCLTAAHKIILIAQAIRTKAEETKNGDLGCLKARLLI
jgi:hypothetical protein